MLIPWRGGTETSDRRDGTGRGVAGIPVSSSLASSFFQSLLPVGLPVVSLPSHASIVDPGMLPAQVAAKGLAGVLQVPALNRLDHGEVLRWPMRFSLRHLALPKFNVTGGLSTHFCVMLL